MGHQVAPLIELLARMAARIAGHDPDHPLAARPGDPDSFDGPIWQHPDFLARAEAAYDLLAPPPGEQSTLPPSR